jgi:hypothetical protein
VLYSPDVCQDGFRRVRTPYQLAFDARAGEGDVIEVSVLVLLESSEC